MVAAVGTAVADPHWGAAANPEPCSTTTPIPPVADPHRLMTVVEGDAFLLARGERPHRPWRHHLVQRRHRTRRQGHRHRHPFAPPGGFEHDGAPDDAAPPAGVHRARESPLAIDRRLPEPGLDTPTLPRRLSLAATKEPKQGVHALVAMPVSSCT